MQNAGHLRPTETKEARRPACVSKLPTARLAQPFHLSSSADFLGHLVHKPIALAGSQAHFRKSDGEAVQRTFTRTAMQRSQLRNDVPDYAERCQILKLQPLETRRHLLDLKLSKKILLGRCAAPNRFKSQTCFTRYGPCRTTATLYKNSLRSHSFFPRMSEVLLDLPYDKVFTSSLSSFERFLEDLNLSDYYELCF
jgi:hypothetical protein